MSTTQQSLEVAQQQSLEPAEALDSLATALGVLTDAELMQLALSDPSLWTRRCAVLQIKHRGVIEGIDLACSSSRKALAELQS